MPGFSSAKGEQTYRRILDATLQVIADEGVRAVTHRRVAKQADASPGLINYYFSTTEELIAGALADIAARETEFYRRLADRVTETGDDPPALVEIFVAEFMARADEKKVSTTAMLTLTLELANQRLDRQVFDEWEASEFALCDAVISALGGRPTFELSVFMSAMIDGIFMYAVISPSPHELLEQSTRIGLTTLFQGLRRADAGAMRSRRS